MHKVLAASLRAAAIVGFTLLLACAVSGKTARQQPKFGINFHQWVGYDAEAAHALDDLRKAGPYWIRTDFADPGKDAKFAIDMKVKGIKVLALLPWYKRTLNGWQAYVQAEVNAAPDVPAWEIANEPEMTWWGGPTPPADYMEMVKQAHAIIRAANPHALIVGPAVGAEAEGIAYLKTLVDSGLLKYVDAISAHYYIFHHNTDFDGLKRVVGGRKPIWITETGWTSADQAGGEAAQLKYVQDYYNPATGLLGADPAVRVILHYEFNDERYPAPAGKDDGWGLTCGPQGRYKPKQAYRAFKALLYKY